MSGLDSPNPYVFVVGCQRSGTTLVERLLDAHPQIAMTHETRWIPELFDRRPGVTAAGLVEPELFAALVEHRRFPYLGMSPRELRRLVTTDPPVSYAAFVSGLFDLYGRARGKGLVGDKTPRYVHCIDLLHELWPRARFIHVIRDGRNVYVSRKAMDLRRDRPSDGTWREHPALTAGLWWTAKVCGGRESGAALGPALYHELRYEALVDDPARQCAALCEFLDVAYAPAMLRFNARIDKSRAVGDRSAGGRKRLPVTAGLRDWRSELSLQEIREFEATGGDLLDELGYERSQPAPEGPMLAEAGQVRDAFCDDLRRRGRRVPRQWSAVAADGS